MLDLPEYQALQALAYEGTPNEVALNFKVTPSHLTHRTTGTTAWAKCS